MPVAGCLDLGTERIFSEYAVYSHSGAGSQNL